MQDWDAPGWRSEQQELSAVQQLGLFLEDVLLTNIVDERIFVFIDEIDSILSLNFPTDDFFTLIRACHEQRALNSTFNRLTFCLFGVATPSDLIADKKRTPFNIGRAVSLDGFQFHEAKPLATGLMEQAVNPQKVLKEVLTWTGGQPFLTQKLCDLILKSASPVPDGNEAEYVRRLIYSQLIENWEAQDVPEHLRTIRNRVLSSERVASRLLGLYQKILEHDEVTANDRPEQIKLQLSGLVVEEQGKLKVANRIYESVFNRSWTDKAISSLRPHTRSLTAWLASNCQDDSRLLHGNALRDALAWAADKSLSNQDYQFLAASQKVALEDERKMRELERLEAEINWEAERKEKQILAEAYTEANRIKDKAQTKAKRIIQAGVIGLIAIIIAAVVVVAIAKGSEINAQLRVRSIGAETLFSSNLELESLVEALSIAKQLKQLQHGRIIESATQAQVVATLRRILYSIKEQNSLESHEDPRQVWCVTFSPDGQMLASGSDDKTVKLWSRDGTLLQTLTGHGSDVWSVSFSPDGQTLASASDDTTVKLWKLDGTLLHTFEGHKDLHSRNFKSSGTYTYIIRTLSFSPNGQMLAAGGIDKTVRLWKLDGTLLTNFVGHEGAIEKLWFNSSKKTITTASWDNNVKLWKLDGTALKSITGLGTAITTDVSFSPDGQTIATSNYDGTVKLWKQDGTLLQNLIGHSAAVYGVSFSPDGQTIATIGWDGTAKLWKPDGTLVKTLSGLTKLRDDVGGVSFSPDGQSVVTVQHKTVKLWKLDGTLIKTFTGHTSEIPRASFSPDGQTIATASLDKTVKLWKRDGTLITTLHGHTQAAICVAFSPDGQTIATASADKTIKLWKRDGTLIATLRGHNDRVIAVSFSPDGHTLASASGDKTVKLWHLDGSLFATLKGHSDTVFGLSFSPDGQILASAGWDKTVKLWKRDGTLLTTLVGHTGRVFGVSFSPDGHTLASASEDKTVILWNFNLDDLVVRGCNWLHDYLQTSPNLSAQDRHLCDDLKS